MVAIGGAAAARARLRRVRRHRRDRVRHPVPGRPRLAAVPRARAAAAGGAGGDPRRGAVPAAAADGVPRPVVGSVRQGLPAVAFADRLRPRRVVRRRAGRVSVEKLLYLPEAHTDFLLAVIAEELGFAGVLAVHRAVRVAAVSRLRDRPAGGASRAAVRRAGRAGHRHVDRRAGVHQHRRQHGRAADQGADAAAAVVRRRGIVANCVALAILLRVDYENRRLLRGFTV